MKWRPKASIATKIPDCPVSEVVLAAIDSAAFCRREPNDDGERIMVLSRALGGVFIFDREEAERRIRKKFPELGNEWVKRAAIYLESRLRGYLKSIQAGPTRDGSWVSGWMHGNYER